jgi:hypothetical protein
MYELIFTVIVMMPNYKLGFSQTMLHSFGNLDQCVATRQYVEQEMLRTAAESKTLPGFLECRKTV